MLMIRLLEKQDIEQVSRKFNLDLNYLESLLGDKDKNMFEYMYVSISDEIDGYMTCLDDGQYIHIKNIYGNNSNFLRHLVFNANKDVEISNSIEGLDKFGFQFDGTKFVRKYEKIEPNNIEIFDYYEQDDNFKKILLEQINEPIWPGAKHLYDNVKNNSDHGRLFIMYDKDKNHIISFGTLHDFDEIKSDELKPWIGSIYTFRPYRGNRFSEKLIKYILNVAKQDGNEFVYLSSDNEGMYEKFGFELYDMMTTVRDNETQVFVYDTKKLEEINLIKK